MDADKITGLREGTHSGPYEPVTHNGSDATFRKDAFNLIEKWAKQDTLIQDKKETDLADFVENVLKYYNDHRTEQSEPLQIQLVSKLTPHPAILIPQKVLEQKYGFYPVFSQEDYIGSANERDEYMLKIFMKQMDDGVYIPMLKGEWRKLAYTPYDPKNPRQTPQKTADDANGRFTDKGGAVFTFNVNADTEGLIPNKVSRD